MSMVFARQRALKWKFSDEKKNSKKKQQRKYEKKNQEKRTKFAHQTSEIKTNSLLPCETKITLMPKKGKCKQNSVIRVTVGELILLINITR